MNASLDSVQGVPGKREKFFYGWWVVLVSGLGLGLGYAPVVVYSFGIFLKPLLQEFHSTRGNISLAFTLANLAHATASPVVGRWADRLGGRRVILLASLIFAFILLSSLILSASLWKLYMFYILLGTAGSGAAPVPYGKVVSNWFDKRRGLALGLTMFGLACGAIVMPSLSQHLIARLGWRGAYAAIGLFVAVVCVPVISLFLRDTPEKMGLMRDGGIGWHSAAIGRTGASGVTGNDAWRHQTFWIMVGALFLVGASVQGCVVHLVPMLTDRRGTPAQAAMASSLLGLALLMGRVISGYSLDRFFASHVAMVFFGAAALGIALLWSAPAGRTAYLAAFLVGLGAGAEVDIIAFLTSRYFGLRAFGEIYGYAFATFAVAGALGPWLMGLGFDHTGSYGPVLVGFLIATLVAIAAMLKLGPYRYRPE